MHNTTPLRFGHSCNIRGEIYCPCKRQFILIETEPKNTKNLKNMSWKREKRIEGRVQMLTIITVTETVSSDGAITRMQEK